MQVDRTAWDDDRERVLSDSEIPLFWAAFDKAGLAGTALRLILLTGQRPGEVAHMRREHIIDGWWEMPGDPVPQARLAWHQDGENHRVSFLHPCRSCWEYQMGRLRDSQSTWQAPRCRDAHYQRRSRYDGQGDTA